MKIFVKTKAGSKYNKVEPPALKLWKEGDFTSQAERKEEYYTVSVKEEPIQGKANDAVMKLLAEYFKVSKSSVKLVLGSTSKRKVFEIKGI
jgi:uncharacterized protein